MKLDCKIREAKQLGITCVHKRGRKGALQEYDKVGERKSQSASFSCYSISHPSFSFPFSAVVVARSLAEKPRENWRWSRICQKRQNEAIKTTTLAKASVACFWLQAKSFAIFGESLPFPTPCALCVVVVCHERENVGE